MKIVILDAGTLGEDVSLSPFRALGDVTAYPTSAPADVAARIAPCDVVVQNKVKITAEAIAAAPHLRLICEAATGYDNIDLTAARARGVAVTNVPGYSTPSVVQVTVATVLSLATHLPAYTEHVRSGAYTAGGAANCLTPVYHELAGLTWGIVGYGNIGRGVGAVAQALGCRVLWTRAHPTDDAACVPLAELCRRADIITLHTPLSDATRGLIGAREIALMKPGVILVNEARGAVTDEAAVADALTAGRLGAFGADVYSAEPFGKDHPFYAIRQRENVCLTPHMAWGSFEARTRCVATMAENIAAFFRGERKNRVD